MSSATLLLSVGPVVVRGQSALDGFDPKANNSILAVAVQPDGKILLGGTFTTLAPNGGPPVARSHIARLNADGTLDPAFNPNATAPFPNGSVSEIVVQPDGKILVGGFFTSIGGQTRNHIARLDPATGAADSFDPNANNSVYSIGVQPDGKVLVGGSFTSVGGQTRNRIARLDAATGLADSFDPNANNSVYSIGVQPDGKVLAAGTFTTLAPNGGATVTRNRIARLNEDGTLDVAFNPNANNSIFSMVLAADGKIIIGGGFQGANSIGGQTRNHIAQLDPGSGLADSFNPNANDDIRSIAVQADGRIVVGGDFTSIGGQTRKALARLDAVTGSADSFNANIDYTVNFVTSVYALAVQADGKILAGGSFDLANGQSRRRIARLEAADGRLDRTSKITVTGGPVLATAVQPDGKTLIGGSFTSIFSMPRNRIARLNTDNTLDTAFNPNASDTVESIAVQPDGKILVGGAFTGPNSIGGQMRNHIARLDALTGLADSFDPIASDAVLAIAVQPDGRILAGGEFNSVGGQPRNHIARLDATTGLADSFDPSANGDVRSIAVQTDGKIVVSGAFTNIGGQPRNHLARLEAGNGLADSFNPNASDIVQSIAIQTGGKILAGGLFTSIGGQPRNYMARLEAASGLADSFDPNANGDVRSTAVQADGRIVVAGAFTSIGGQTRNRIARLEAGNGLADSFDPNASDVVEAIALRTDGKIMAGGHFDTIGGQPFNVLARLSNDTAALQHLTATQTAVIWTRGGSSPQFTRVSFEYSADNVTYTPLGNGMPEGNNWVLTGLNLPGAQSFYVRARGYCRNGVSNGSESLTEFVRYGPVGTPTPIPTATPSVSPTPVPTPTPPATPSPTPTPGGTPRPPESCEVILFHQEFDQVTPPQLPAGWPSSFTAGPANCIPAGTCSLGTNWVTTAASSDTFPNSAFHDAPGCVIDSSLDTPSLGIGSSFEPYYLRFWQYWDLENGNDGAVLEVSINGGPFTDILAAGGSVFPAYNGTISSEFMSPLAGRRAWTGNSGGYVASGISMPQGSQGYTVVFRFRLATDCSVGGGGWLIDSFSLKKRREGCTPTPTPTPQPPTPTPIPTPPSTPTPTPIMGALLDTITGADTTTFTGSTPRTYMGDSWTNNAIPANSTWVKITGLVLYMTSATTQGYIDVVARIQFWNSYDPSATPVFGNSSGPLITVDFGPLNATANTIVQIPVTLSEPVILTGGPGTNWGFAQNFQGNTGSGLSDTTNLTSVITAHSDGVWAAGQITTGTAPQFGYYRNASGRVDFNFSTGDLRILSGLNAQGIGIIIGGTAEEGPTPTPIPITPTPTPTPVTPSPTPIPITPTPTPIASPTPDASQTPTPAPTGTPDLPPPSQAQPLNISTRLRVQAGNNVGIGGFIIKGNVPKTVAVRGIGPSLTAFGLNDALPDPTLELRDSSGLLLKPNDNWQDDSTDAAQLIAHGLALQDPKESGVMATLQPNASYTAILAGKNQTEGVGLIEIYDVNQGADSELANISTRGFVLTDNNVMIGGFILGGTYNTGMVVRGIGPSLAQFGLNPVLADPTLELHDSNGATLVSNDNWQDDTAAAAQLVALGLAPQNVKESALVVSLPPGAFTAILAGKNAGTGIGLVEIYNVH